MEDYSELWNQYAIEFNNKLESNNGGDWSKIFDKAYKKVFARFENDNRIKSYGDIAELLTEGDIKILESTYDAFDERLGPLLCKRAYEFYCEKLKKTL